MILPQCHHTMPTKANLLAAAPSPTGWIFTCLEDFEHAVRANVVKYADLTAFSKVEAELVAARGRIQALEGDIQDLRMLTKQAFVRCAGCQRLKEISKNCRWCER